MLLPYSLSSTSFPAIATYLPTCLPTHLPTYLLIYLPTYLLTVAHSKALIRLYHSTYPTYLPTCLPTYRLLEALVSIGDVKDPSALYSEVDFFSPDHYVVIRELFYGLDVDGDGYVCRMYVWV